MTIHTTLLNSATVRMLGEHFTSGKLDSLSSMAIMKMMFSIPGDVPAAVDLNSGIISATGSDSMVLTKMLMNKCALGDLWFFNTNFGLSAILRKIPKADGNALAIVVRYAVDENTYIERPLVTYSARFVTEYKAEDAITLSTSGREENKEMAFRYSVKPLRSEAHEEPKPAAEQSNESETQEADTPEPDEDSTPESEQEESSEKTGEGDGTEGSVPDGEEASGLTSIESLEDDADTTPPSLVIINDELLRVRSRNKVYNACVQAIESGLRDTEELKSIAQGALDKRDTVSVTDCQFDEDKNAFSLMIEENEPTAKEPPAPPAPKYDSKEPNFGTEFVNVTKANELQVWWSEHIGMLSQLMQTITYFPNNDGQDHSAVIDENENLLFDQFESVPELVLSLRKLGVELRSVERKNEAYTFNFDYMQVEVDFTNSCSRSFTEEQADRINGNVQILLHRVQPEDQKNDVIRGVLNNMLASAGLDDLEFKVEVVRENRIEVMLVDRTVAPANPEPEPKEEVLVEKKMVCNSLKVTVHCSPKKPEDREVNFNTPFLIASEIVNSDPGYKINYDPEGPNPIMSEETDPKLDVKLFEALQKHEEFNQWLKENKITLDGCGCTLDKGFEVSLSDQVYFDAQIKAAEEAEAKQKAEEEAAKKLQESMAADKKPPKVWYDLTDSDVRSRVIQVLFPGVVDPSMNHLRNFLTEYHIGKQTESYAATKSFPTETLLVYEDLTFAIVKFKDGKYWRIFCAHTDVGLNDHTWIATHSIPDRWVQLGRDIQENAYERGYGRFRRY